MSSIKCSVVEKSKKYGLVQKFPEFNVQYTKYPSTLDQKNYISKIKGPISRPLRHCYKYNSRKKKLI